MGKYFFGVGTNGLVAKGVRNGNGNTQGTHPSRVAIRMDWTRI